ncbi:MAG TPA: hypothetical protein EYP98_00965, partial [Planctomycetes bacterium]|nr:hypothetical protein [Planctomycetota bacterium]
MLSKLEPDGCPDVPASKIISLLDDTEINPLWIMELYALGVFPTQPFIVDTEDGHAISRMADGSLVLL